MLCIAATLLYDFRSASHMRQITSSSEVIETVLFGYLKIKSFLDTDWLTEIDKELKHGSSTALHKFRIHLLRFRFIPEKILEDEMMPLLLTLHDERLRSALEQILDSIHNNSSQSWRDVHILWSSGDSNQLHQMISSLKLIEFQNSSSICVKGTVSMLARERLISTPADIESSPALPATSHSDPILSLRAALGLLHCGVWPLQRARAVLIAAAAHNSPYVSVRLLHILSEVRFCASGCLRPPPRPRNFREALSPLVTCSVS